MGNVPASVAPQPQAKAAPVRSCIGCRQRRPANELIRLVLGGAGVKLAAAGAPGRGAYLCPSQQCFDAAATRRAASRAFRRPVMLDDEARHAFMAACQSREAVR